jgi:hypothetical protein
MIYIVSKKGPESIMVVASDTDANEDSNEIKLLVNKIKVLYYLMNGLYVITDKTMYPILNDKELLSVIDSNVWKFNLINADYIRNKVKQSNI